jgi:Secretion system C-terminal sorting domain
MNPDYKLKMYKMKKIVTVILILMVSKVSWSQQFIHSSIQQGASANKVDIVFKADYNSGAGEYVNFLQFGIAVPATGNTSLVPVVTGVGNFTGLNFVAQPVYTLGTERIYNWGCTNFGVVTSMAWAIGNPFTGITISFTGGGAPSKVRLVDFTNQVGDGNTLFIIGVNSSNDPVDYGNFFFSLSGGNGSTLGNYPLNDKFVETNLLISLPVNMLNFSGYKNGSKNTLHWTVASEVNNKGFDVQRSADGVNYSSIGFVNSQATGGFTNAEMNYGFDDNNPAAVKKQYYRLNQLDIDGRSKLSNIVMITGDKPKTLGIGGLFPNPASTVVNVLIDAPGRDNVTLVITDMGGKTVKQQLASVETGSNTVPMDIAKLASGSYLVKVLCKSSDCETAVAKFNKQ